MPLVPRDTVRVRAVFDLAPGKAAPEIAVMGFHMVRAHEAGSPTDWPKDVQQIAEKVADKWAQRVVSSKNQWPTEVVLNRWEAYHLDENTGHTLDKGVAAATGARAWAGTNPDSPMPFEVACAVSLYGYPAGGFTQDARTKRGRYYLPPLRGGAMAGSTNAGLFATTTVDPILADQAAFLNDVHLMGVGDSPGGLLNDSMRLVVLSRARVQATDVQQVRIGLVPDSQRRRRNKQPEQYRSAVITQT